MFHRLCFVLTIVALSLVLTRANAQAQEPEPAGASHAPFDPTQLQQGQVWPGSVYPEEPISRAVPKSWASRSRPAGIDLEVTYLNRTPSYHRYCLWYPDDIPILCPGTEFEQRWPEPGEVVTFTAHIVNKGTLASPPFAYQWLIDGIEVASGTQATLAPGAETTATYLWTWNHVMDGERVVDDHTVRFALDPDNTIRESYETNNSLEDRTNALSLHLAITPEMYQAYETPWNPAFPYSAENWLQRQIAAMNRSLAGSTYPLTPQGATERVRIDAIEITEVPPVIDGRSDGTWFVEGDYRIISSYYDPVEDVDWGLVHELSHQIGLIDLYNLNLEANNVYVRDREGNPTNFSFWWAYPGLMFGGETLPHQDPHLYSSHSAAGLSSTKGYRRGHYGEYQYDIPEQNYLLVLDNSGNPAAGVQVELYQRAGPYNSWGELGLDDVPEISLTTGSDGRVLLTNRQARGGTTTPTGHTLHPNPFGVVDVIGQKNRFLLKLSHGNHEEFRWLDISAFNLAYWQGNRTHHTFVIHSHVPPAQAPVPPTPVAIQVEGDQVKLCWQMSNSANLAGYHIYRAGPPTFTYERASGLVSGPCYEESYDGGSRIYAVTAVASNGQESGFSPFIWTPRLLFPSAVTVSSQDTITILDPQNGHALLRQQARGRYLSHGDSTHHHLDLSQFLATDPYDRLLLSHPGDYYTSRHSVQLADQEDNLLLEFGEWGSEPGQFKTPAGVAAWSGPCTQPGQEACLYRILVADSGNHRIQAFDAAGNFISAYGRPGEGPDQFNDPQGIAVSRTGEVIVVDRGNNRLKVLSFDGTTFSLIRHISANFNWPTGVVTDKTGQIIVADSGNNRIKVLDPEGQLITEYEGPNDGYPGTFNWPQGVAVDSARNIIVADTGNRRVVNILATPPQAAFGVTPTAGIAPLQVSFTDQSTGNITHHLWDFGDGQSSSLANPVHTYTSAGAYTVSLTVSGPGGTDQRTLLTPITVSVPIHNYLPLLMRR